MKTYSLLAAFAATTMLAVTAEADTGFLLCQGSQGCRLDRTEVSGTTPVLNGPDFEGTSLYGTRYEADMEVDAHFKRAGVSYGYTEAEIDRELELSHQLVEKRQRELHS